MLKVNAQSGAYCSLWRYISILEIDEIQGIKDDREGVVTEKCA